jgi:hypothetical protein
MGTSYTPAQFSQKIVDMATITQRRQAETVNQGALVAKEIIIAEAAAKGVSPQSKIAGGKWGVRYDVRGFNNPSALVKILGPFHLVDGPSAAHKIYRKAAKATGRGSGRANRQARFDQVFGGVGAYTGGALKLGDGKFRHVVNHPGTQGKGIFKAAKIKAGIAVPRVMGREVVSGWEQALR